jgi:hypothetical protein
LSRAPQAASAQWAALLWNCFVNAPCQFARLSFAKMIVPMRCEQSAPMSLSATSPVLGMSHVLWRVASACTSA